MGESRAVIGSVRRLREPMAWVVLAVALTLAVGAVVLHALRFAGGQETVFASAAAVSRSVYNPLLAIALAAVVAACALWPPPSPHARTLTAVAAVFALVATGLLLVFGIIGLGASGPVLAALIDLAGLITIALLPALSAWLLLRAWLGLRGAGGSDAAAEIEPSAPGADASAEVEPVSWRSDASTGAVWHRAADAASGAEASDWGRAGEGTWAGRALPTGGAIADGSSWAGGALPAGGDRARAGTDPPVLPRRGDYADSDDPSSLDTPDRRDRDP